MSRTLTQAGRYQIVGELGRGSMGVVYKGFDPVIGRTVAIKTMLTDALPSAEFEEYKARFQREAQAAGILTHPNIVTVYDFGEDAGVLYLAMEFLEGESLQHLVERQGVLPVETIVPMYEQVCSALDAAHAHRIVHRDVKPANIMILDSGLVKMTDFGIAKFMHTGMTQVGQILGTPNYMSPEQVKGRSVDGRSDIFSLGVILYELVTGEKPFGGQNITTVIYKIINEDPIPPRELDPTLHLGLCYVIQKALAKNPNERYQNCRELADDLRNYRALANVRPPSDTVAIRTPIIRATAAETVVAPSTPTRPVAVVTPQRPNGAEAPLPPKIQIPPPPRIEAQQGAPTVYLGPENSVVPRQPAPAVEIHRPTQFSIPRPTPIAEPAPPPIKAVPPMPAPPIVAPTAHAPLPAPPVVALPPRAIEQPKPAPRVAPPVISAPQPAKSSPAVWAVVVLILVAGLATGGYFIYRHRQTVVPVVRPEPTPPAPTPAPSPNPVPVVSSISPASIDAGSPDAALTVTGSGFTAQSTLLINGSGVPTTFHDPTQLTATIPANLLSNAGSVQVSVSTPAPGGGTSAPTSLTVAEVPSQPEPTPQPEAVGAGLSVQSDPSGAQITLDGRNQPDWVTPYTFKDVAQGTHTLSLSLDGYKSVTQTARVRSGQTAPVSLTLRPAKAPSPTPTPQAPPAGPVAGAGFGLLKLVTSPPGAQAYIDDKLVGTTPTDEIQVSAGTHKYKLVLPGFTPFESTVEVPDGMEITKPVRFGVGAAAEAGTISITTSPTGASVSVDGIARGTTPASVKVNAGTHHLILSMAGYQSIEEDISVAKSQTVSVDRTLNPR